MPRVIHFEIAANDPEKMVAFYKNTFGWEIQSWEGPMEYYLIKTGDRSKPGIDGAITPKKNAVGDIVNTIDVPSFDEALKKVVDNGGKAISKKTLIPGVGTMCYCEDIEGNKFGIMEALPNQVMVGEQPATKPAAKPAPKQAVKPAPKAKSSKKK